MSNASDKHYMPTTVAEALELYLAEIGKSRAASTLNTYYYTISHRFNCFSFRYPNIANP